MIKKSLYFIILFSMFQTFNCFGQWAILHVTLNNTDSSLNTILLRRQTAVAATTASYETILNSLQTITASLFSIRNKEYLMSPHDKNHYVATALRAPYVALLTLPSASPSFFPLYSTSAKRDYFEKEIGLITTLFVDMNVTGRDNFTRNANTQELYLLRKEMILNIKKVTKNPKKVYALLFGVALVNNLIYPELDQNLVNFLFNEL